MADIIKTAPATKKNSSSGRTAQTTGMGSSSARSETRLSGDNLPTRKRRRRSSKADASTLLEIAQSALARLGDAGIEVYVRQGEGGVEILIRGTNLVNGKVV